MNVTVISAALAVPFLSSHAPAPAQVLTLPPGAIRLATSPTAINELWCYGPNILASQFHVEFDEPLVLEKIWQSLKDNGRLDVRQAEESRRILEAGGQQNLNMLQVRQDCEIKAV